MLAAHRACVSCFLLSLCAMLFDSSKIHLQSPAHSLWKRFEKGAGNVLKEVDEIPNFMTNQPAKGLFSAILTKSRLQRDSINQMLHSSFGGFHKFTALITTTSLIVS